MVKGSSEPHHPSPVHRPVSQPFELIRPDAVIHKQRKYVNVPVPDRDLTVTVP